MDTIFSTPLSAKCTSPTATSGRGEPAPMNRCSIKKDKYSYRGEVVREGKAEQIEIASETYTPDQREFVVSCEVMIFYVATFYAFH